MGPIFDRVLTHRLSLAYRILVPITGALWLTFAWVVKANNTGALFAMMAVIGVTSVPTLPIALELACELTRNPEGSSALLWSLCVSSFARSAGMRADQVDLLTGRMCLE